MCPLFVDLRMVGFGWNSLYFIIRPRFPLFPCALITGEKQNQSEDQKKANTLAPLEVLGHLSTFLV